MILPITSKYLIYGRVQHENRVRCPVPRPDSKSAIICRPPSRGKKLRGRRLTKISGDVVPLSVEVLAIISDQVTTRRLHGVRHVQVDNVTGNYPDKQLRRAVAEQVTDQM